MALSAPTQWEVRSGGSDTLNSGGFNPGSANFLTNWAVSSANTSAPVVSSASYSFVAGDVGAKFLLQIGTNGIPAWYTIVSVNAGAATLTASIGSAILYDVTIQCNGLNTVSGCGTSASLTSQTGGIDYSQQNSNQFALTGLTSSGVGAVVLTTSAANSMLGNIWQQSGGTNLTIGLYEIIAISAGVSVTLDRSISTGIGASGSAKIGGALATLGKPGASTVAVAGNTLWTSGSFTLAAIDTISASGTIGNPIFIKGYGTYRGDGYQGRTSNVKGLVTTNMPTLAYNSTFRFNATGSFIQVETLVITATATTLGLALTTGGVAKSCKVTNAGTNAATVAIGIGAQGLTIDCDTALTGASGGLAAITATITGGSVIGCHVTASQSAGISCSAGSRVIGNLVTGCASFGISVGTAGVCLVQGNTIAGNSSDGINITTGTAGLQHIYSNMITDNSGYGINMVSTSNSVVIAYNYFRKNSSGAVGNASQWSQTTFKQEGYIDNPDVTGSFTDYTDQSTGDYSLKSTSPAVGASQPYAASMGCFQRVGVGSTYIPVVQTRRQVSKQVIFFRSRTLPIQSSQKIVPILQARRQPVEQVTAFRNRTVPIPGPQIIVPLVSTRRQPAQRTTVRQIRPVPIPGPIQVQQVPVTQYRRLFSKTVERIHNEVPVFTAVQNVVQNVIVSSPRIVR